MLKLKLNGIVSSKVLVDDWFTWLFENSLRMSGCYVAITKYDGFVKVRVTTVDYAALYLYYITTVCELKPDDWDITLA
jgi:fructose-1,6-bisphosphatase/inositol monophosphatase family enzyme